MVRVVFMCGPAGSGKSTVARRWEANGFVRLSYDQEAWDRGIRHMPLSEDVHSDIGTHLQRRLAELVGAGRDVVLDFSFWSRAMREEWRRVLGPLGVVPETIYLATERSTCLERIAARGLAHGDDFAVDTETAAAYFDHFEPPTPDEGPLTVMGQDQVVRDGDIVDSRFDV
jgi:predicted kinase